MSGNSLGVFHLLGVWLPERSEGSPPGEPQRSAVAANASADSGAASRPDPEVVPKAKRRTYTAEYRQRILEEAERRQQLGKEAHRDRASNPISKEVVVTTRRVSVERTPGAWAMESNRLTRALRGIHDALGRSGGTGGVNQISEIGRRVVHNEICGRTLG
jgi:hypothetical protein